MAGAATPRGPEGDASPSWALTDGVVTIRPSRRDDLDVLLAGRDEAWRRWLGPGTDAPSPTACVEVAGRVVGWVDADADPSWLDPDEVNVGYSVFAAHRGHGYAARAVTLLAWHLRATSGAHAAALLIDPANGASLRVARALGLVPVGAVDGSLRFRLDLAALEDPRRDRAGGPASDGA